jgi:hypothetical protein
LGQQYNQFNREEGGNTMMGYRKHLTNAICLISVCALTENAEAWHLDGFTDLHVYGCEQVKGPLKKLLDADGDGEFDFDPSEALELSVLGQIQAACRNVQTGKITCQPGEGNSGFVQAELKNLQITEEDAEKGRICIDGYVALPTDNYCHADSPNKEIVPGSARVTEAKQRWAFRNPVDGEIVLNGSADCTWSGMFHLDDEYGVCEPDHNKSFDCYNERTWKPGKDDDGLWWDQ